MAAHVEGLGPSVEQILVGVYLFAPDRPLPSVGLDPAMFRSPLLGATWGAICAVRHRGERADLVRVGAQLRESGEALRFASGGGVEAYLSGLANQTTAAELHCAESAAASVRDDFALRQICARYEAASPLLTGSVSQARAALRHLADEAERLAPLRGSVSIMEKVRLRWSEPPPLPVPTGIGSLDRALGGGLLPRGLSVLVAGTGRGKTGLAIQIALAWLAQGRSVLHLSTEMDERQGLSRVLGQVLGRPWRTVYEQGPEHIEELVQCAQDRLAGLRCEPLGSHERLTDLLAGWLREQEGRPLAVILDHLTDAARSHGSADMRHATQAVTAELKHFASKHGVLVLAVTQTARAVTQPARGQAKRSGRAFESAAKDAGEVEADSEALMYLDSDPCPQDGSAPARLHISKSRGSACNQVVPLCFHGALGVFTEDTPASQPSSETQRLFRTIAGLKAEGKPTSLRALKSTLRMGQDKLSDLLSALEKQGLIAHGANGWQPAPDGARP
ncbi:MAG: DnaB-like helicase C-terminal domain-containing protein [Polyangia bacterium]